MKDKRTYTNAERTWRRYESRKRNVNITNDGIKEDRGPLDTNTYLIEKHIQSRFGIAYKEREGLIWIKTENQLKGTQSNCN